MLPTKVVNSICINENQGWRIQEEKNWLDTVKTKENAFLDINIEEIVRAAEEHLKKKQEQTYLDLITRKIPKMTMASYQKKARMTNETISI